MNAERQKDRHPVNGFCPKFDRNLQIMCKDHIPNFIPVALKPRTHDQIIHRFRPRCALLPIVGTGRFDVTRGLVRASAVSRVVAVNSSEIKGPEGTSSSAHYGAVEIFAKLRSVGTARLFEFHRSKSTNANLERLEVWPSHKPLECYV
ncbi:hypothetical protein AVEN_24220-1 [Araneus ventricosus]|uniref:Uncharacterized protein n=1 Tax=Araneus ventricosus TaxID=182803 RepID=A0A4Y2VGL2_ARAVE|nr:hypothetical protein AVEN_24220-1 [Araneus ventricosus]